MSELLTPGQEKFAGSFAQQTGLDPRVVGAWLKAEQSGSAAKYYEDKGYSNWLNIANTDSGPAGGAHSSVWSDPESAAKASAEWMKGTGRIAKEYGAPAEGIRNILHTRGQTAENQIKAIAGSGWASSGYNGGNTLRQLYGELSGHQLALMSAAQRAAGVKAGIAPVIPEASTTTSTAPPKENPIDALMAIHTGQITPGTTEDTINKNWEMIKGLFDPTTPISQPHTGQPPRVPLPGELHEGPTKLGGFLPHDAPLTMSRIDQGQDIATTPGGPILAPGNGVVLHVLQNPGGFGENYPVVHFTSGPLAGHDVYIGHTHSVLKEGDQFRAGQTLSLTGHGTEREGNARTPGWAEIGFWGSNGPGGMEAGKEIAPYLR